MYKKFFLAVALLLSFNLSVFGQIRYLEGYDPIKDGELQISVIEYTKDAVAPNTSNISVTLYGVTHVADLSYYRQVQNDLDTYDCVLYEGVKQGTRPNPSTSTLNMIQKLMGDVLGLTFQKDGIDYRRDNFVHADITMDQLEKSLKGRPIDPLEQYFPPETIEKFKPFIEGASELIKMLMKMSPDLQNSLKVQLARQLAETDISGQLPPEMKKAILDDRNQFVQEVLIERIETHPEELTFAIFYGCAHNPDFEKRLQKLGFKRKSERWMTAWFIGNGAR